MVYPTRGLMLAAALLALGACKKAPAPVAQTDDGGGPAIMTSIDDVGLPVDKSDQITAIDAASGDASGMPDDGGAVVELPKAESAADPAAAPDPTATPPATVVPPAAVPGVPSVTPPPAPATAPAAAVVPQDD